MAVSGIQTGIELNDGFTNIVNQIISSVNLAVSAMESMQGAMDADIDTSSIEGARAEIDQATMAVNELEHAMAELTASVGTGQVINVDVTPVTSGALLNEPQEIRPDVLANAPPIEWQTDGLDVFTSSGVERFQQEIQSANAMLQQLSSTQDAIARQAFNTTIFPQDAFQSLNTMAVRIDNIRECIQQIENNPLNMGTDAANAEMEQLRSQLNRMVQEQNELNAAMNDLDVSAANDAYLRLNQIVSDTERHLRDNVDEQGRFNREIEQGADAAGDLQSMIVGAVSAFAGVAGIRKAIDWIEDCTEAFDTQRNAELQLMTVLANTLDADYVSQFALETEVVADTSAAIAEINDIQNQVDDVTITVSTNTQALTAAFDEITQKASEIQAKGIYGDEAMIAGAAEFSTYFSDITAIKMMMDTLADYAMGMSGGGAVDSTAMVNYATGLGKIMTGSYEAMTKKGFEFTDAQKAIIDGSATQEQIIAAIGEEYLSMSEDVQAAAAINAVIAESWDGLYESMSDAPEGKIIQMTNAWGDMKEVIGGQLYPYVILFVDAITSHWGTIQIVLDDITLSLQFLLGVLSWLLEGALSFSQVIIDNWSWISPIIYGIVAALAVYGAYLAIVKITSLAAAAAQWVMNSAFLACPLTWIIILIIALIAVIFAVCNAIAEMTGVANSGFGVMTGGVNVVIQFFKNLGLTVANIALGIGNAIAALGSNMMTAFNNAICSIQSWFWNLLSTALSVIGGICEELNKLPFVEFDYSGITSAADEYAAKAAEAIGNKEDYQSISDAFNEGFTTFDTFQDGWVTDAFNAGAAWGDGVAEAVGNFSLSDLFDTTDIPSPEDYTFGFGDDIGSIAGDTGAIRDSMDITQEELKYLRDIAEQEAVNRFTTAEINIDMSGMQNTVNSGDDMDGFITKLTDSVNEAVDSMTEGVHE